MQDYTFVKKLLHKDVSLYRSKDIGDLFEVFKVIRAAIPANADFKFFKPIVRRVDIDEVSWVIMRHTPNRSFSEILSNNNHIEEPYLRVLFSEICRILSVLHSAGLTGLPLEPENLSIGEGGEILIDNYFKMNFKSSANHYFDDLEHLSDFIYKISRLDRTKTNELCVSRRFTEFLVDLNKFPMTEIPPSEQIGILCQNKLLTSQKRKTEILLDLIEELSEFSESDDLHKAKPKPIEVSNYMNNTGGQSTTSGSFDRPETSGSVALLISKIDISELIKIIEDVFVEPLEQCRDNKITYGSLLHIRNILIEMISIDPHSLKEVMDDYLKYRQLLPKTN